MENSDAAYNLARWLVRNDQDAQDVVQESCVKALRAYDSCRGEFRTWFLAIVRNTSLTWLRRTRANVDSQDGAELAAFAPADPNAYDPQTLALRAADTAMVRAAIEHLPENLRETLVLREMEGMSYRDIARIVDVPIGTVMSRLARGRTQLQEILTRDHQPEDLR